jgi:hypothetical protein
MSESKICPNCKEEIEGEGVQRGGVVYCSEACAFEGGRAKDCAGRTDVNRASLEDELEFRRNPPTS